MSQRTLTIIYDVSEIYDRRSLLDEKAKFHDLIGDIPPAVQTSLLRVRQEREITRVGESNWVRCWLNRYCIRIGIGTNQRPKGR